MSLKSTNKVETNKVELEIEISPEAFEEAIEKHIRRLRKIFRFVDSVRVKLHVSLLKRNTAKMFSLRTP